ncbi:GGDEF domain-containing protein [Cellulomonas sp.]|uniref:GGDEF domain-containing protein n=1 Tax=Cellulomonas sp. TaxID=40001 RepID=UPI001B03ECE9|nr:GGDEF domain-containing protein [Cellulomonas sp.]MBO9556081.1 GGDEF domain-containing protein [Cellulomonas sp.]
MSQDLTHLTQRLSQAVGDYRVSAAAVVADLAHPVDVVDADLPVARLELVFRSPHVASVAVRDPADESRIGLITRPRYTAAMTGRLGFGRAILARKETGELADWAPMVVPPTAAVSEVAVRAMERHDERRYDDVLVGGDTWQVASTADLVRSLSTLLAVRSLHDPVTGLMHRSMLMHSLGRRCAQSVGTPARTVVVLLDLQGFAHVNAAHGQAFGDVVLTAVGARLRSVTPQGCDAGRTGGDEFAVVATMPGSAGDTHAAALADGLRQDLVAALAAPAGGIDPGAWPPVHSAVVVSAEGGGDPEGLVRDVQQSMRNVKAQARQRFVERWLEGSPAPGVPDPRGYVEVVDI